MGIIRNILIGMLIFSGIIVGLGNWQGDLFAHYSVVPSQNLSHLNFVQEINNQTETIANDFQQTAISTGTFAVPLLVAQGIYDIVKLLLLVVLNVFQELVYGVAGILPGFIPTWFIALVISAVVVIVLLALVDAVLKSNL